MAKPKHLKKMKMQTIDGLRQAVDIIEDVIEIINNDSGELTSGQITDLLRASADTAGTAASLHDILNEFDDVRVAGDDDEDEDEDEE